jgi:protein-disulfide isomerase
MKNLLNGKMFILLAVVLIGASVVYANYASKKANEGVVITENIKGNPEAAVVLTEYSDFQCPACGQFYPIIKTLVETYGDDLAFEYKHFPLITIHPFAVPAAKAAEAAGQQGKFFEMHDKLFENQQAWSRAGNPRPFFDQYAEEIDLDMALFKQHYGASLLEDKVIAEYEEARELGLTGTPSFFLNGERLQYNTFEEFMVAIESALGVSPVATTTETVESEASTGSDVRFGF